VKRFAVDLHIHTALSPCALDEMTPVAIAAASIVRGLDLIAICDHNTAGNVEAVQEASGGEVVVLAGMEITTVEEVHVLGIFPSAEAARSAGEEVLATLPEAGEEYFARMGEQRLMEATGEVIEMERRMLIAATPFDLSDVVGLIRRHQGLAIASHVDRPSFSVVSQLGVFPDDVRFDAVEVSRAGREGGAIRALVPPGVPLVASSDSHTLDQVGSCFTEFELHEPTFDELALALRGSAGRRCLGA